MTRTYIENAQKQALCTGNESGFHEAKSTFLSRFFGLVREHFSYQ